MLYTEKNDNNIFERHRIIGTIVCITVIPLLISIGILFKFIPNAMVNQMVHIGSPLMVIASIFLFYVFKNFGGFYN